MYDLQSVKDEFQVSSASLAFKEERRKIFLLDLPFLLGNPSKPLNLKEILFIITVPLTSKFSSFTYTLQILC